MSWSSCPVACQEVRVTSTLANCSTFLSPRGRKVTYFTTGETQGTIVQFSQEDSRKKKFHLQQSPRQTQSARCSIEEGTENEMENMSICAAIVRRSADSLLQSYYDKSPEHNQSVFHVLFTSGERIYVMIIIYL